MTDAIQFFQSFNFFGLFSTTKINSSERKLSRELIKDARKLVASGEAEAKNGGEAKNITLAAGEYNLKQSLASIAIWHLEISAKYFRQAAARYNEASVLRADQQRVLQHHSEKNMNLAEEAENTVRVLRGLSR